MASTKAANWHKQISGFVTYFHSDDMEKAKLNQIKKLLSI